jgi:SOS response regulatory protein OraA/RecX
MTSGERLAPVTWLFGSPDEQHVSPAGAADSLDRPDLADVAPPAPALAEEVVAEVRSTAAVSTPSSPAPSFRESATPGSGVPRRSDEGARPPGSFERINNVSMHALGRRDLSVSQMRRLLEEREFDSDEAEAEITRLVGVGLLDDARLAETLVRTLRDRKGLGRTALAAELGRRGLDPETISEALAELGGDELERAIEVARRRAPQLRSVQPDVAQRRLAGFLARKGYSGSIVRIAVERALRDSDDSGGPRFR